jgi:hypothetical protein
VSASTIKLHRTIIRMVKGIVTAWEDWLTEQERAGK